MEGLGWSLYLNYIRMITLFLILTIFMDLNQASLEVEGLISGLEQVQNEVETLRCSFEGQTYAAGERFFGGGDPCVKCECSEATGAVRCMAIMCDMPMCVDPVKPANKCCKRCPAGKNCLLDGEVIGVGKKITEEGGPFCKKICRCPRSRRQYYLTGVNTNAKCKSSCKKEHQKGHPHRKSDNRNTLSSGSK